MDRSLEELPTDKGRLLLTGRGLTTRPFLSSCAAVHRVLVLSLAIAVSRLVTLVAVTSVWVVSRKHKYPLWESMLLTSLGRSGEIVDLVILGQLCSLYCGGVEKMDQRGSQVGQPRH